MFVASHARDFPTLAIDAAHVGVDTPGGTWVRTEVVVNDPTVLAAIITVQSDGITTYIAQVVRQNLRWSAFYNLAAIPLAALGLMPPWVAAIGMSTSSLIVVLNARRIQHTA